MNSLAIQRKIRQTGKKPQQNSYLNMFINKYYSYKKADFFYIKALLLDFNSFICHTDTFCHCVLYRETQ